GVVTAAAVVRGADFNACNATMSFRRGPVGSPRRSTSSSVRSPRTSAVMSCLAKTPAYLSRPSSRSQVLSSIGCCDILIRARREQHACGAKVVRLQAFREPAVDRLEDIACGSRLVARNQQFGECHRGTKLPRPGLLLTCPV